MTMSSSAYADAINFINLAYNPNVASYFPQPLLYISPQPNPDSAPSVTSTDRSLVPDSINVSTSDQPQTVSPLRRKGHEVLWCEICSIHCNSKMMLEKHILGKKHRKKIKNVNSESSMLDSMKAEFIEGEETKSLECIVSNALAGSEGVYATNGTTFRKEHAFVVEREDHDTTKPEPSSNCPPDISEIHIPKPQNISSSVEDDTCKSKEGGEKHLAGKHALKVKQSIVMSSPVSVYPVDVLESNTLKLPRDSHSPSDSSSVDPVGGMEVNEDIHSEGGTAIRSPNVCTICNIECNSQELFKGHLSGRKHASKVRRLSSCIQILYLGIADHDASRKLPLVQFQDHDPVATSNDLKCHNVNSMNQVVLQDINPSENSKISQYVFRKTIAVFPLKDDSTVSQLYARSDSNGTNGASTQYYESETTKRASKRGKIVQFAYCDVCKVYCNSSEVLSVHILGKRHMKQLEKLEKLERTLAKDTIAPRTIDSVVYHDASKSDVSKQSMVIVNQVETPKGVINSPNNDNVKEICQDTKYGCTLCNVVCNGQTTFSAHLAGSRHAVMLRKAAVREIVEPGPLAAGSN